MVFKLVKKDWKYEIYEDEFEYEDLKVYVRFEMVYSSKFKNWDTYLSIRYWKYEYVNERLIANMKDRRKVRKKVMEFIRDFNFEECTKKHKEELDFMLWQVKVNNWQYLNPQE